MSKAQDLKKLRVERGYAAPVRTFEKVDGVETIESYYEGILSDEEIELIAKNVPGDLRTAFGVLKRISLYDSFPETFPDAPSISEIIRDASFN